MELIFGMYQGIDVFFMPYSTNGGWDYVHYHFSPIFKATNIVIMSGTPPKNIETSFTGLFVFQNYVIALMALFLSSVSAIWNWSSSFTTSRFKRKQTYDWRNYAYCLWQLTFTFINITNLKIGNGCGVRILMGSWLFLAMIVSLYQGSFFKTKMSIPTYSKLTDLQDLPRYSHKFKSLRVINDSFEHHFIAAKSRSDVSLEAVVSKMEFFLFEQLLEFDFLSEVNERQKTLLTQTLLVTTTSCVSLTDDENYRFYFSRPLKQILYAFLINRNVTSSRLEKLNLKLTHHFESTPFEVLYRECERHVVRHTWTQPITSQESEAMDASDLLIAAIALGLGSTLASLLLTLQVTRALQK